MAQKSKYVGNAFVITEIGNGANIGSGQQFTNAGGAGQVTLNGGPYLAATIPANAQFTWTDAGRSKPREAWEVPIRLRTVRTDYSDKPTEQVLGPVFEDFTLNGVWDNRYNGGEDSDYAEITRENFEALVRRGNLCRFDFEGISIVGLIKQFKYKYKRRGYQSYSFTVSPHFNTKDSKVRQVPNTAVVPQNTDQLIADLLEKARQAHVVGPKAYIIKGVITQVIGANNALQQAGQSIYDQVSKYYDLIENSSRTVNAVIENRTIKAPLLTSHNSGYNTAKSAPASGSQSQQNNNNNQASIQRLIQELRAIKDLAKNTNEFLKAKTAATDIIYQDASVILQYQTWCRNLSLTNRQLIRECKSAIDAYTKLLQSDIIAIYRPTFNESLYSISTRFYGTPDNWNVIYTQNNLKKIYLEGDEMLKIPKVS